MSARHRFSPNRWARAHATAFAVIAAVLLLAGAVSIGLVVAHNGTYPGGIDTLCHIYKGDVLSKSIGNGQLWPLFDPLWYNGVQMMRYWAPLPVYAFAACESLAGGDPLAGFTVFCGAIFFLGGLAWLIIGMRLERPWLGLALGILWFFLPNNLIALFYEGNLPRCISLALLPALIYLAHSYLEHGRAKALPLTTALFALMALCHSGFAGMVLISLVIYLVFYGIVCRTWKRIPALLASLLLGYAVIGIWLVPSLIGGITSTSSNQIMEGFFQSLFTTLNPLERSHSGNTKFYYGAVAAVITIAGILFAKRRSKPGFIAAAAIVLCTSDAAYPVLSALPGGQYLWMLRFVSIALALALFSLLTWRTLKTPLVVACCLLLAIDAIPSLALVYGTQDGSSPYGRLESDAELMLVNKAKEITTQRLALVDESHHDSESAYVVTGLDKPLAMSEGAAWQSSVTSSNFMQLDRALEEGEFEYLFDRSIELGDDSVIVLTSLVREQGPETDGDLDQAAKRSGYRLVATNGAYRLYHRNTPSTFGVQSSYRAIAIGTSAHGLALQFPAFEEADSTNLDDYTYDELKDYDVVFLGGFTYSSRANAEALVSKLADHKVRVVIAADGIPSDEHTGAKTFLGLDCEQIDFKNGFPELKTKDESLVTTLFPNGYENWSCVYVNGIEKPTVTIEENGRTLPVVGSLHNDNIQVIGLNLTYYESLTHDDNVAKILSGVLGIRSSELPQRKLVELSVTYSSDGRSIAIDSPADDVNTTLAYQDVFESESKLTRRSNLLCVGKGSTIITMSYPYLVPGLALSTGGIAMTVALYALARRREKLATGEW